MARWCPECNGEFAPNPASPETGKGWEEEFDRLFVKHANNPPSYILGYAHPRQNDKPIKEFIYSLLRSERQRWEGELREKIEKKRGVWIDPKTQLNEQKLGFYNAGIDVALALIDREKEQP